MDYPSLIVMTYLITGVLGYLMGRYVLPGKRKIIQTAMTATGFLATFAFLWLSIYFSMGISLYDVYRDVTRTTIGIIYIIIFRYYIGVFVFGIWINDIMENRFPKTAQD